MSQFRKYSEEATREIKGSVVEPLEEVQAPLREAVKPLEDLDKTVKGSAKDLNDSFAGIGKPKKAAPPPEAAASAEAEAPPEAAERRGPRWQEDSDEPDAGRPAVFKENSSI